MNSENQKIVNLDMRESRERSRVTYLVLFDRSVVSKSNIIVHVKVEHGSRLSSILVHDEIVYKGEKGGPVNNDLRKREDEVQSKQKV